MRKTITFLSAFAFIFSTAFLSVFTSASAVVRSENPFFDTNLSTVEGRAAAYLHENGVIGGYSDGEFKGDREVNRAELAKFLLLAKGVAASGEQNHGRFGDVAEGAWYTEFVIRAADLGILGGYDDGTFRPANSVNTAEFIKMAVNTFGLSKNLNYSYEDIERGAWFAQFAGTAQKYNFFPQRSAKLLQPARVLTRDEVAVAIYKILTGEVTELTTARASSSPSAQTIKSDQQNVVFLKFNLTAGVGNAKISKIEFTIDSDSVSSNAISNFQLVDIDSKKVFFATRRDADLLEVVDPDLVIPANSTKNFALRGDIDVTGIVDSFAFELTDIVAEDMDDDLVFVSGLRISSSIFTIVDELVGVLDFGEISYESPPADIIVAGEDRIVVARFLYYAEREDMKINKLRIINQDSVNTDDNIAEVHVSIDGFAAKSSYFVNGEANLFGFNYVVEKGETAAIEVSLDLNSTSNGADSGDQIQIGFSSSGFSADGQFSLEMIISPGFRGTNWGKAMTVYKSKPRVKLAASSPSGSRSQNINDSVLLFDVAADDAEKIKINQITVRLGSDGSLNSASAGRTAYLKSQGSTVATGTIQIANSSSGSVIFVPTNALEIFPGSEKTFTVQFDTTNLIVGQSGVDDWLTSSIFLGDASTDGDFWWSDGDRQNIKWLGFLDDSTLLGNTLKY